MFLCSLDKNNINGEYMFSLSKCCEELDADFKRKVLLSTQREINEKTDLYFEFDEVKEEKKIVGIHIVVHRNNAFKNSKKMIRYIE